MPRRVFPLLLIATLLVSTPASAQDVVPTVALERQIFGAFDRRDYDRALELIEDFLERSPDSTIMLYNAACASARLGQHDTAATYLKKSVDAGYRDFAHMRRDPDLDSIREHPVYEAILADAKRIDSRRARNALRRWRATYGEANYRYETDPERMIDYATSLDDTSHREMREMLERQCDQMAETLFGEAPDYMVLIAVPSTTDATSVFRGDLGIGGIYEHGQRRLIARDIGSALRHEFFHVRHYGHMERLQQTHPIWIQEGIATLYEDYRLDDDGTIEFLPNERHNITRRRARSGRTLDWSKLFSLRSHEFMRRAGALYPQARSIFEYVAAEGELEHWYATYVDNFDEDRTGKRAFEIVFNKPIDEIERDWRRWVLARPAIDVDIDLGDAALGIETTFRSSNDGVVITRVLPSSTASQGRLRVGDVIVAIDDIATRSLAELRAVIGRREVGDRITVRIRRNEAYLRVPMTLRPFLPNPPQ